MKLISNDFSCLPDCLVYDNGLISALCIWALLCIDIIEGLKMYDTQDDAANKVGRCLWRMISISLPNYAFN